MHADEWNRKKPCFLHRYLWQGCVLFVAWKVFLSMEISSRIYFPLACWDSGFESIRRPARLLRMFFVVRADLFSTEILPTSVCHCVWDLEISRKRCFLEMNHYKLKHCGRRNSRFNTTNTAHLWIRSLQSLSTSHPWQNNSARCILLLVLPFAYFLS